MAWLPRLIVCLLVVVLPVHAKAQDSEKRIAIVIGNAAYQAGALNTAANDAGLIAQTLEAAGFNVVGARDLDQDTLRRALRDFLDKAQASGPNTVAFIYLSGYGLQLEGENYFVPVDARIARDADVASQAIRVSDYTRPLAALGLRTSVVVLDAARPHPFGSSDAQLLGSLALVEPETGMLVAFNAAPDTVAPEGQGPYGPYAQALAEMMREGGLPLAEVFERVRLRVNEITGGAEVPWHASKVQEPFVFFERAPDAPPPPVSFEEKTAYRARPIRDLGDKEAYVAALERDTLEGYLDFLAVYPDDPMALRVRAIVAARREAITWRRTRAIDTPEAYWSYLRRYPQGRHAHEARRRLAYLAAVLEPPPSFTSIDYEVPPPPPEEFVYVERRVLIFDDPVFAFAPPPPPPLIFLAPRPPEFVVLLAPPPPPIALFVLPIPIYRPVPIWVRPPVYVAPPPPNNVIFNNIHNTVVINNTTNVVTITNRNGQTTTMAPPARPAAAPGAPAPAAGGIGPALPPSVAQKASQAAQSPPPGSPGQPQTQQPGSPMPQPGHTAPGQPLPGMKGVPLPMVPPLGPSQPGQPAIKQPGAPSQTVQPPPKGQTPPPATGVPPTAAPLPGQPATKQLGPPPQPGQAQPLPKGPLPPTKGGPPAGSPQPARPAAKQQVPQQVPPGQGQPSPKGQNPPTGVPPSGAPQAQQQRQLEQAQQRQKQLELQKQKQDLQRQQQLEQQQQRQIEQQRQQQEQQRQRQLEQQRLQQQEQQRQRQIEQQHQQQEQQRQRQIEQQRLQQEQQRQRQIEQQRQQQIQQRQPQPQKKQQNCGTPGQPACPK